MSIYPPPHECVSMLFIGDLHCDGCVHSIEESLFALSPAPSTIDISVTSQSVKVYHSRDLLYQAIQDAIHEAGFHIVASPPTVAGPRQQCPPERHVKSPFVSQLDTEDQTKDIQHELVLEPEHIPSSGPNAQGAPRNSVYSCIQRVPLDSLATLLDVQDPVSDGGPYRVTLSIGGMTCSACSTAVTHTLSELPGVTDISVSLLSNSATVVLDNKKNADPIVEAVEDCGFEVQIINMESLQVSSESQPHETSRRTISLRVDGMFSPRCPEQVMTALNVFGSEITIIKPLTNFTDPILQLSYEPAPPSLTIRAIMSTITSSRTPPFEVSIHATATIEDLARKMRMKEQAALLHRLAVAVIVAIPTFVLAIVYGSLVKNNNPSKKFLMEPLWTGNTSRLDWALFFLATPVMFYSASLFHLRSIKEIRGLWRKGSQTPILRRFTRFGSMNLLVSSGVSVAYFSSIALLFLAALQPPSPQKMGDNATYFDSVVFLTMFLLAGRCLEAYSKARTADSIMALGSLRPTEALLLVPRSHTNKSFVSINADVEKGDPICEDYSSGLAGAVDKIDVRFLEVGDIVRVPSGSTPPCDGTIVAGQDSAFDESSLTGESRPVKKQIGDQVFVGTINKSKVVDIRVDAVDSATMLGKIIDVVREGQTRKAPIERVADLITGYFVPVVTLLAISTWLIWLSLGLGGVLPDQYLDIPVGGWTLWSLEFAIAVFVVACPCGIGLAAPTALLVGTGLAAKFGILARGGGEAFQDMANVDLVVFDKTGTLTEGGNLRVSDCEIFSSKTNQPREAILGIAAALETSSSHPLATAVRRFCENQVVPLLQGSEIEEIPGRGLQGKFETLDCTAIIGNEAWMTEHGASINKHVAQRLAIWKSKAKSVVLFALRDDSKTDTASPRPFIIGAIFAVMDPVRAEAKDVVSAFHRNGISTWMISGDNFITATSVAAAVGIPKQNVIAGVLPHEKAEKIEWLQRVGGKRENKWKMSFGKQRNAERCVVAMVGDGINDAPALSIADVGIAIGSGSDVAISSASFVLLSSHLGSLLTLRDLSCKVLNRIKFNFLWAICYNLAALPIAAGVVYPLGHARLSPVWASLAMALSSVSVVCSSLLLKLYKEPKLPS